MNIYDIVDHHRPLTIPCVTNRPVFRLTLEQLNFFWPGHNGNNSNSILLYTKHHHTSKLIDLICLQDADRCQSITNTYTSTNYYFIIESPWHCKRELIFHRLWWIEKKRFCANKLLWAYFLNCLSLHISIYSYTNLTILHHILARRFCVCERFRRIVSHQRHLLRAQAFLKISSAARSL